MYDIIIKGFFSIFRIIANIFTPIIQNIANTITGTQYQLDFSRLWTSLTNFTNIIAEGGIFMKRFLLIPNGILGVFFVWVTAKMAIWLLVRTIKLVIRIYDYVKP